MYQGCLAFDYAKFYSRSNDAVIRVYDETGNVIETHEHKGDFLQDATGNKRTKVISRPPAQVTRATKTHPRFWVERVKGLDLVLGRRGWRRT